MELGFVERVGKVEPLKLPRKLTDVAPAFAVEGAGRTEDDSYRNDANQQDRGMEDDLAEIAEESGGTPDSTIGESKPGIDDREELVNLFA